MTMAPSALSEELLRCLLATLSTKGYEDVRDAVLLAARTGLRLTEILSLHWSDLNDEARSLSLVNPKNSHSRVLFVPEDLLQALASRRERCGTSTGLIFGPASQVSLSRFKNGFAWYTTSAGKKITWSMLRHCAIKNVVSTASQTQTEV